MKYREQKRERKKKRKKAVKISVSTKMVTNVKMKIFPFFSTEVINHDKCFRFGIDVGRA